MRKESNSYIPRILELGLNNITDQQLKHVGHTFGEDFLKPASQDEITNAREYINGPKKEFETKIAAKMWMLGGQLISTWAANEMKKKESGSGYYILKVGFNGNVTDLPKIKTLKNGSDKVKNDLFLGSSFSTEAVYVPELLIPGTLAKILRSGGDESPQIELVKDGKMFLLGPRGYTSPEHDSNDVLYELKDSPELANSELVKWILEQHQDVTKHGMLPGIINLRSSLRADLATHIVRMYLDVQYIQKANKKLDSEILVNSMFRRFGRIVRALKKN